MLHVLRLVYGALDNVAPIKSLSLRQDLEKRTVRPAQPYLGRIISLGVSLFHTGATAISDFCYDWGCPIFGRTDVTVFDRLYYHLRPSLCEHPL